MPISITNGLLNLGAVVCEDRSRVHISTIFYGQVQLRQLPQDPLNSGQVGVCKVCRSQIIVYGDWTTSYLKYGRSKVSGMRHVARMGAVISSPISAAV